MRITDPSRFLRDLFQVAVCSVSAEKCLPPFLADVEWGKRTVVIGAGKAAAAMAQELEQQWRSQISATTQRIQLSGLVVTPYAHGTSCAIIEVVEAAHPVPDVAGQIAAQRILQMVQGLDDNDLVICLISGGGSALLALPAAGITLDEKRAINKALLKSGAAIDEMNCVRKHLSAIKGGRLGLACAPARVLTLLISDVPEDDASVIASGPTLPDATTCADALAVLNKYAIEVPAHITAHLQNAVDETPKPGDCRFASHQHHIIATAQTALQAAAAFAKIQGIAAHILSDSIEGEAREVGKVLAALAKQVARHQQPFQAPCVILSGGETTVTVQGKGRGGRNAEFLLSATIALNGHPNVYVMACDTDGIDGSETNAGALCTPTTLQQAQALQLSAKAYLANNDAYSFFAALDQLIVSGPTRTNVNDLRAFLIL
jgi:hydroxypyruvate reductase